MKKSYIVPEIKTMIVENTIMAASDRISVSNTPAASLGDARSRFSSDWDDSEGDDLAWD